jgi:sugar lactone lactonase YvrE
MLRRFSLGILFLAYGLVLAWNVDAADALKFSHSGSAYADGRGAALSRPEGVACGPGPTVVVADTRNGRLVRYALSEETLRDGNPISVPQLKYPVRVHIGTNGDILVLDGKLRRVLRLNAAGEFVKAVEPLGVPKGNVVPKSFALDREDGIYFLDIFSRRVVVTDPSGNYQREIPFPEKFGFFSDLAVDGRGTVFLLDSVAGILFAAEKGQGAFSLLTKDLKEYATFPANVTTDGKGAVYVVDQNGGGVIVLGQDGSYRGRQLGMGWKEGLLYYPSQMCVSGGEIAVIADRENNRVQVFKLVR